MIVYDTARVGEIKLVIMCDSSSYYFFPLCSGHALYPDKSCLKSFIALYNAGKIKSAKGKFFEFVGDFDENLGAVKSMGYSTNIVIGFGDYVLKSYRKLGTREPELMRAAGEIAPEVCGWGKYDEHYVQLITRKIEGEDMGRIFYENHLKFQKEGKLENLPISEIIRVVSHMHKLFEKFGIEKITESDVTRWRNYVSKLTENVRVNLRVDTLFSDMIGKEKLVTHQDLHLSQMLLSHDKIYVIDFEGEPVREHTLEKLQPIRDIATLARAVGYITSGAWDDWEHSVLERLYDEYRRLSTYRFDFKDYVEWIIEKCVYEIYYETLNRPEMVYIPLRGLENSVRLWRDVT